MKLEPLCQVFDAQAIRFCVYIKSPRTLNTNADKIIRRNKFYADEASVLLLINAMLYRVFYQGLDAETKN